MMATTGGGANDSSQEQTSESLLTLAGYLELSLDAGACVVMLRRGADVCPVYIGDPAGTPDELTRRGSISISLANEILETTHAGVNRITIGEQAYQFFRSFTQIEDSGAVVFAPI
jgi:hypothetical protein